MVNPGQNPMPAARVLFPLGLDAYMPALDGHTPIVADEMNDVAAAIEALQVALGWGPSPTWKRLGVSIGEGPKGENASVKDRIDELLDRDGGLKEIVLVTGESAIHDFDENGPGVEVAFPRPLSGASVGGADAYAVWFQCYTTDAPRESDSNYPDEMPGHPWVHRRWADRLTIKARGFDAGALTPVKDRRIKWACLVLGGTVPGVSVG